MLCDPDYAASAEYERFWGYAAGRTVRARRVLPPSGGRLGNLDAGQLLSDSDEAGTLRRVFKVATDLTRQVQLDRAFQANQAAMQSTMTELGAIVSAISGIAAQAVFTASTGTATFAATRSACHRATKVG